jgi:hypothetical protein
VTEFVRLHPDDREAIAQRVAELLRGEPAAPEPGQLLTATEVARLFGLSSREWVYEHKAELGAIELGSGSRPRLRFDRQRVAAALAAPGAPPATIDASGPSPRRRRATAPAAELLPIRGHRV